MTAHVTDLFNLYDFFRAESEGLISRRFDDTGLEILNYTDRAVYTSGAFDNPAVRICRGLIVNAENGDVVARSWEKFFNHNQAEAGDLLMHDPVEVTDKMDGSLGIIHRALNGEVRVATRGSFESDQAKHATAWLRSQHWFDRFEENFDGTVTPLVEIIYPDNRIVCDYGDWDELVLLGGVSTDFGTYHSPTHTAVGIGWPGAVTEVFEYPTLRDALMAEPRPGAEGLCVRYLFGKQRIVKIKQDDYVALHKIVTGLSERSVWESVIQGESLESLLEVLPDELHEWTRNVWNGLHGQADQIYREADEAFCEITGQLGNGDRKDFAEAAMARGPLRPYLFNLLDGKDPYVSILKSLKPAGDSRARVFSEVAA